MAQPVWRLATVQMSAFESRCGQEFSSPHVDIQPAIQKLREALSSVMKLTTHLSGAEAKKTWIFTSVPPYAFVT
jgi:hypothetical protein